MVAAVLAVGVPGSARALAPSTMAARVAEADWLHHGFTGKRGPAGDTLVSACGHTMQLQSVLGSRSHRDRTQCQLFIPFATGAYPPTGRWRPNTLMRYQRSGALMAARATQIEQT